jgi:hypothetical protein
MAAKWGPDVLSGRTNSILLVLVTAHSHERPSRSHSQVCAAMHRPADAEGGRGGGAPGGAAHVQAVAGSGGAGCVGRRR